MCVSAIITTYNRDYKTLKRAIESVLNQTYEKIEIIVVNDTPKDNPLYKEVEEYIKEYGNSIKYFANGINRGACYARNLGVEKSNGNYVAFLDDDDEWESNKVEQQTKILENKDFSMVTVGLTIVTVDGDNVTIKNSENIRDQIITLNDILKKNVVGGASAPLMRKEVFLKAGGFDNDMPAAQDYDLWIRMACLGDVYFIGSPLQKYYVYKGERISNNSSKKIIGYKKLIEKYSGIIPNNKKFLMNKYVIVSFHYFKVGDKMSGFKNYIYAIQNGLPTTSFLYYTLKILLLSVNNKKK